MKLAKRFATQKLVAERMLSRAKRMGDSPSHIKQRVTKAEQNLIEYLKEVG